MASSLANEPSGLMGLATRSNVSPFASRTPQGTCPLTYTQVNERLKVTRSRYFMLFAAILTFSFTAGIARADPFKGDPRRCALNNPASCARSAAKSVLKRYMAAKTGALSWDADITCTATAMTNLKWSCAWKNSAGAGTAIVWFRATSTGWKRVVTVA